MADGFDLRSKAYWRRLGWGVLVGLLSAIGAFVFVALMNWGIDMVWPDPPGWEPFSGSWTIVLIMTIAGLLVGLIHRYTDARELNVFEALDTGHMDYKPVPASLLASLVSLVGGFSLGPEVPTGMLAAGLGTWLSEKRQLDEETAHTNVLSGVGGAYAGLFSSPLALLIMILESTHMQTVTYYGTLFIVGLAAAVGFALFFWLSGDTFSSLLRIVQPPAYDLRVWQIGLSILLGLLAFPIAVVFRLLVKGLRTLVAPLNKQPILRGLIGGLLLGLLGKALPITLFLGTAGLSTTTSQAAEIGVGLLILFALAKVLALGGALSFGFIGGPIFPLLFVGATLGSAINLLFPQIPLGLAVGCMMAAVPAAIVPIPVALAVIVALIVGLSPLNVVPVVLASMTSFAVVRGLSSGGSGQKKQTTTAV
ncbi:MAG: chloride channel protein [Anaerolineae bacterium]|nr:chloride channel protein [Anaerolineae bacterium]MCB9133716.1 chloride channel protein [Anaerolineales bacterium]MCB0228470.1 chloride channel protein [Anaerolineae bacterium]MCB0234487.1 chloride channel protein [Anaerolineae bacterium]MCB0239219.1 chloride channel protein [Anaerolineae bacterium]